MNIEQTYFHQVYFYMKKHSKPQEWWRTLETALKKILDVEVEGPVTFMCGMKALELLHNSVGVKGEYNKYINDIDFANCDVIHYPMYDSTYLLEEPLFGYPITSYCLVVLHKYNVHDHLRPKLCDLYENDCIFDKFEAIWSGDDSHLLTGS
jgi:hypothetical protein